MNGLAVVAPRTRGRALFFRQLPELAIDVRPFPQAMERQEILATRSPQLIARQRPFQLVIEIPQIEQS